MIHISNVVKRFRRFAAVDGVSLSVEAGRIHGFLGPNGAGKTTTIRMVAGLLKPSSGHIEIDGRDIVREPVLAKASLGFIPDRPFLYEKLTAEEFLRFHGGLFGMEGELLASRIDDLLGLFDLRSWRGELIEAYSHGMRQRLVMCSAFLHQPKAVVVDEPMVGLDPRGAHLIKDIFRQMAREGVAILMSTHTLEVAEDMCDHISIISAGRILASGTVDDLRELSGARDERLTPIFLRLTGGSGLREIEDVG